MYEKVYTNAIVPLLKNTEHNVHYYGWLKGFLLVPKPFPF